MKLEICDKKSDIMVDSPEIPEIIFYWIKSPPLDCPTRFLQLVWINLLSLMINYVNTPPPLPPFNLKHKVYELIYSKCYRSRLRVSRDKAYSAYTWVSLYLTLYTYSILVLYSVSLYNIVYSCTIQCILVLYSVSLFYAVYSCTI